MPKSNAPAPDLGAVLAAERAARGLSVRAWGRAAGVHLRQAQNALSGTDPRLSTLLALLGAVGRDLAWLHGQGVVPPGR